MQDVFARNDALFAALDHKVLRFAVDVTRHDLGKQRVKPDQFNRLAVNAVDKSETAVAL